MSSSLPEHITLTMPALSPTMERGNLVAWHKQEGDLVEDGDALASIETDKATLDFESTEEGYIAKILVPAESSDVEVNTPVAILVEEEADVAAFKDYEGATSSSSVSAPSSPSPPPASSAEAAAPPAASPAAAPTGSKRLKLPSVSLLLHKYGLSEDDVTSTGRFGLLKGDVLAHIKEHSLSPAAPPSVPSSAPAAPSASAPAASPSEYTDVKVSQMRSVIAARMVKSKTEIPYSYTQRTVELDAMLAARKRLAEDGVKASVNDFVIKAAARALRLVPEVNSVSGEPRPEVDISVAVAIPGGLITPIVRGADGKSLSQISSDVRELAGLARAGKLTPEQYQGGTFSVSNLGMFGISHFTAIINQPQSAILAVAAGLPGVCAQDGQPRTNMTVTLSSDSRVISDQAAAAFLEEFAGALQQPLRLI